MRISYSPRSLAQIRQAFDYIVQDNPAAANAFLLRVETIMSLLAKHPGIGRMTSKAEMQVRPENSAVPKYAHDDIMIVQAGRRA